MPILFMARIVALVLTLGLAASALSALQSPDDLASDDIDGSLEGGGESLSPGNDDRQKSAGDPVVTAAARIRDAIKRIDPLAEFSGNSANFTVERVPVTLVYDLNADRMRLVAPIASTEEVDEALLLRLMQANFESALDARYAIAQGALWSTFIHPLSQLSREEFVSGLGQTVNLVLTFGRSYNSGAVVFGGGDNSDADRSLIEELDEKSKDI